MFGMSFESSTKKKTAAAELGGFGIQRSVVNVKEKERVYL